MKSSIFTDKIMRVCDKQFDMVAKRRMDGENAGLSRDYAVPAFLGRASRQMAIGVIVVGGQLMGHGRVVAVGPTEARQGGGPKEEVDLNDGRSSFSSAHDLCCPPPSMRSTARTDYH
jgi:hypothetical protein